MQGLQVVANAVVAFFGRLRVCRQSADYVPGKSRTAKVPLSTVQEACLGVVMIDGCVVHATLCILQCGERVKCWRYATLAGACAGMLVLSVEMWVGCDQILYTLAAGHA